MNREAIRDAQVMLFRTGLEEGSQQTTMRGAGQSDDQGHYRLSNLESVPALHLRIKGVNADYNATFMERLFDGSAIPVGCGVSRINGNETEISGPPGQFWVIATRSSALLLTSRTCRQLSSAANAL
jgi:hypothetical protein